MVYWFVKCGHILKQAHHKYFYCLCCVDSGNIVHKNMHMAAPLISVPVNTHLRLSTVYILYA